MSQVQNFVAREKRKSGVNKPLSKEELRQYCEENSQQPDDRNQPFVIGSVIGEQIFVGWSTRKLLAMQHNSTNICVDATYKIVLLNWPILVSLKI
jgi:hypothetical protein